MRGGWVYIMTNRPNGVLYTGVTSDVGRRAYEHREGLVPGFTKRYGLKRLVYMEFFERIADAIQREKNIKHWPRAWKARLILDANPGWNDLYETLNQQAPGDRVDGRVKPGQDGCAKGYVGEACPECGAFTMVRNGTCLKCDTCGGTTGCS